VNLVKRLLTIFIVLFLGIAAYFLVSKSFFSRNLHVVDLVSSDAIIVFETKNPVMAWNQLVTQPLWERLGDLPSLQKLEGQLLTLDSLAGGAGNLEKTLKGKSFATSLHQTGKEEFDFLFSIDFSGRDQEDFIQMLTEKINPQNIQQRNYSGVNIFEYQDQQGTRSLSYALVENLFVASFSSFLIEDAIRHTETDGLSTFRDAYSHLFQSQEEPKGLGIFRLSSAGVAKFILGISRGSERKAIQDFSKNEFSANLEVKFSPNKVMLEGISFFGKGEPVELSWNKSGETNLFNNYISNRTAIYHQFDVSDPLQIQNIPTPAFEMTSTVIGEMNKEFQKETFLDRLTGEVGYLIMEDNGQSEADRVLLIKTREVDEQITLLKDFSVSTSGGNPDQMGHDFYLGKEIFVLGTEEFPAHVFDGQFVGFQNSYVLAYNDMVVMSNNIRALKIFLDDVLNDNTWGKSIRHKQFLQGWTKGAGYSFMLNVPRFWTTVIGTSSPEWKVLFQKYAPQFKSINWVTLQRNDESTSMEFQYNLNPIKNVTDIVLAENMTVPFNEELVYGPKSLHNFNDRSSDYLVQDALQVVHVISGDGDIIFSQEVEGKILGDVFQIDYYKNGKLQILFATDRAIYAIDRFGNLLPEYPIALPNSSPISHMNLVDYDNSRDYRYFVGTGNGELYLMDKNGNNLEGWTPKNISGPPASRPAHHRLSGSGDYMVTLNTSGELFIMNRKGELMTGDPISLGNGLSTDYALIERGGAAETQLVTINEEGEVVRANFNGELTYRNQLLRPDRGTKFHLIKDQSHNNYLFVVHEYNKISILNGQTDILFEKGMYSDDLSFQFFSFGGDKNIFVVIDKVQEFIYLYNLQGELLNTRPLDGNGQVEVKYSGSNNEYSIMAIHANRFSVFKMPL
jgi:hypothetical protein